MSITFGFARFWPIGFDQKRLCVLQGASLDFRNVGDVVALVGHV